MAKSNTSTPTKTKLRGYASTIAEAIHCENPSLLTAVEEIMRNDIFHSTLDWQTREMLQDAAREAVEVIKTNPRLFGIEKSVLSALPKAKRRRKNGRLA